MYMGEKIEPLEKYKPKSCSINQFYYLCFLTMYTEKYVISLSLFDLPTKVCNFALITKEAALPSSIRFQTRGT